MLLPLVVLVLALIAAAPAHAASVSAGPLTAEVRESPWHVSFDQRGVRLAEHRGRGPGATGALGFRTAAGTWARATRVLSRRRDGRALVLELATTDPAGRRLRVRVERAGQGIIRLRSTVIGATAGVTHSGMGFAAEGRERYLGFGQRANAVDQRGRTVDNYVADGPYQQEEYPVIAAFVSPPSFRPREDATYFPMPWLLSTRGYGVLEESSRISQFRLGSDARDAWSVEVDGSRLSLLVFAGPRPAGVVRRLTTVTGRQPRPAAPWFFGPWFQTGQDDVVPPEQELGYVRALRDGDAPVSVAETHLRYLPCAAHLGRRDAEHRRTAALHARGLATLTYVREVLCTEHPRFEDASRRDLFLKNALGQDYVFTGYDGGRTPPVNTFAQPDFTAPGADQFYAELLAETVEDGHDGFMEDFGEATPLDSRAHDGTTGEEMHNLYPVLYHRAGWRFARRQGKPVARFIRSGWTGVHPYAQIVWGGDPTVDWGFDGLSSVITNGLTIGLSGISTWGHDIGGFHALFGRRLTRELLIRWIQTGSVSPVMRTKAEGVHVPPTPRPQIWEPEILPQWRRWAKLHTQLNPYLRGADAVYRRTGLPLMRHFSLAYPGDARAVATDDAYLFGPDLLAAPVTTERARERRVYVPGGRWVDLWRSARYESRGGGIELRRARVLRGRREATLPAPLSQLPLLVRAGAVLPLLPRDVDTLADYGAGAPGLVRAADRRGRMELLAFPRGSTSARFNEDERLRSVEARDRWTLRFRTRRARTYRLQASLATLRRPFRPCRVVVDGRVLARARWRYDRSTRVLRVDARVGAGGSMRVVGCAALAPRPPAFTG
jgi:alpha-glucosidase (family GH31 glycosyl hydrolase)